MSDDNPDEISISPGLGMGGSWYPLELSPEWDGPRYVRKELYDALKARVEGLEQTLGEYRKFVMGMMADKPESSDE